MRIERQERRSGDAAIYIAVRSVLLAAESWIRSGGGGVSYGAVLVGLLPVYSGLNPGYSRVYLCCVPTVTYRTYV
jgi:hypothetical protein